MDRSYEGALKHRCNSPEDFQTLNPEIRAELLAWIEFNFEAASRKLPHRTSYGIKHDFSAVSGHYITNGQFKGAMVEAGHQPVDASALNWTFRISVNRTRGDEAAESE